MNNGEPESNDRISLYFHIPFCSKKCPYCHFYVLPDLPKLKNELLNALELEWKNIVLPQLIDRKIISIYFGGGTPFLFGPHAIETILSWIRKSSITIEDSCEITLEANPENITSDLVKSYALCGINRFSIGVQSLDDSSLITLGRTHNSEKALKSIDIVYQAGIKNISIDLMYDLPSQTLSSFKKTLLSLKNLPITHLSLYNLTIEANTGFYKRKASLLPLLPDPDLSLEMLTTAISSLETLGFKRYEISAFAKEEKISKHNIGYWTGRPFLGLGPSAFSYLDKRRFRNIAHFSKYHEALKQSKSPVDFEEKLERNAQLKELLAINLRLLDGVNLKEFEKRNGILPTTTLDLLSELQKRELLEFTSPQNVKLSEKGLLFYDSVAAEII